MNQEKRVWYVSYGSNLYRDRFMTYIKGGVAGAITYAGAENKRDPKDDRKIILPHPLVFAGNSAVWGGGVAYLNSSAHGQSVGRAYLITWEQFLDVITQENFLDERVTLVKNGSGYKVKEGLPPQIVVPDYDEILGLGIADGVEILTFSAALLAAWEEATPEARYMDMLTRGAAEANTRPLLEFVAL